jgi:beta-N-acetylglucosaminidase
MILQKNYLFILKSGNCRFRCKYAAACRWTKMFVKKIAKYIDTAIELCYYFDIPKRE